VQRSTDASKDSSVTTRDEKASRAPEHPAKLPLASETVKKIQSTLRARGFYDGPVDGIVGSKTEQAIAAYQQRYGLSQIAALELQTLQSLIADAAEDGTSGSGSAPR
jgi:peptidoglycan hydrolase-like protein with peptidoglycan-binding domain